MARELARRLNYRYIDTGAMYRAVALAAKRENVDWNNPAAGEKFLQSLRIRQVNVEGRTVTLLGEEDVSEAIRSAEMGLLASEVSGRPEVRERLLVLQREMGAEGGVVMEGRDIGTVVFPEADFKFFLTASAEERARRRCLELRDKGEKAEEAVVLAQLRQRDHQDSSREVAPLRRAPGAREIDSTNQTVEEVVEEMLKSLEQSGVEIK